MSAYEERLNEIEEAMKTDGCNTLADINTITLGKYPSSTLNRYVKILAESKPELGWVKEGEERSSRWRKKKMSSKKPESERYPESKNDEGYNDPTAFAALKRTNIDYKPDDFGLIVARPQLNERIEYYVQVQDFGSCGPLVVPLIPRDKWYGETSPHMVPYRFKDVDYYIDCRKLRTLNPKWIARSEGYVTKNTQMSIRTIMMRMLGFNIPEPQIIEVEKPASPTCSMVLEQDKITINPIDAIDVQRAEKRAEIAEMRLKDHQDFIKTLVTIFGGAKEE